MNIHPKPPEIPIRDAEPWWQWLRRFIEEGSVSSLQELNTHINATTVHSATSTPLANRIILRDAAGRAEIQPPESLGQIAQLNNIVMHAALNSHKYARSFMLMGG